MASRAKRLTLMIGGTVLVAVVAGCVGITAGLLLRKSIPAFLIALVSTFVFWLLGGAFGLASGFGQAYQFLSRFTPNNYAVELLFPLFYGARVGSPLLSILTLVAWSTVMLAITGAVYYRRVVRRG